MVTAICYFQTLDGSNRNPLIGTKDNGSGLVDARL